MIFPFALISQEILSLPLRASKKAILTDYPTSKFSDKTVDRLVWILQACMSGVLDPYKSFFLNAPPKYLNCIDVAPSDIIWKTIDN